MGHLRRRLLLEWSIYINEREITLLRIPPGERNGEDGKLPAEKRNGDNGRELVGKPRGGANGSQPADKLNGSGKRHNGTKGKEPAARMNGSSQTQIGSAGNPGLPLFERLHDPVSENRAAAAKAIGQADYPDAPEALVGLLQDEDLAVRWAAMSSLISYRCKAVRPLMLALTRDFHSINLRQGAHHVFKALADYGDLNTAEMDVFQALEHARPVLQVARLANQVLIMEAQSNQMDHSHHQPDQGGHE